MRDLLAGRLVKRGIVVQGAVVVLKAWLLGDIFKTRYLIRNWTFWDRFIRCRILVHLVAFRNCVWDLYFFFSVFSLSRPRCL